MQVEWRDDLLTGDERIDEQHKELFRRINALVTACKEGKARHEVENLLNFLGEYVQTHFAAEERLQLQYGYPEFLVHKAQHEAFLDELRKLQDSFDAEGATLSLMMQANKAVFDWLRGHIIGMDKGLAEFIRDAAAS